MNMERIWNHACLRTLLETRKLPLTGNPVSCMYLRGRYFNVSTVSEVYGAILVAGFTFQLLASQKYPIHVGFQSPISDSEQQLLRGESPQSRVIPSIRDQLLVEVALLTMTTYPLLMHVETYWLL